VYVDVELRNYMILSLSLSQESRTKILIATLAPSISVDSIS